jgi:dephospho-CoA kinase
VEVGGTARAAAWLDSVPRVLWVGLTGGIGAGKSAVSRRLVDLGAALVDADRIAREVVEPGTAGLAAVVEEFGPEVVRPDGSLDRDALGRVVFGDDDARRRLNAIVHPLIGARTAELAADAEQRGVEVLLHDVPLLVEGHLAPAYHLVLVVEAPLEHRMHRLTRLRGMPEDDARARVAAQAGDEERRRVADVLLVNDRGLDQLAAHVRRVWHGRIRPYARNLARGRRAESGPVALVPPDPRWGDQGRRLVERLRFVCGHRAVSVEHIGSTAVAGLAAKDVIDLQVEVASPGDAGQLEPLLTAAGFPRHRGVDGDPPRAELDPDPAQYWKHLHHSADPGRPANVHVRVSGSTAARATVALRDLLRTDARSRAEYENDKRRLAAQHGDDVDAYAEAKTPFLVPLVVTALRRDGSRGSEQ